MLPELHESLRRLLYERGGIDPDEVEISFEAPTEERINRVMLPTLSLFLFDVQENTEKRQSGMSTTRANGQAERRMPPRRIDLRYLVSALTTEIEDEHRLLWRAMLTLLKHPELPRELVPEEARALDVPISTRVVQPEDGQRSLDIWSGLGAKPRPSLVYVVTAPVDLEIAVRSPLVLTRTVRYRRSPPDEREQQETRTQVGGVVRGASGAPLAEIRIFVEGSARQATLTDAAGRYILSSTPLGSLVLQLVRPDGATKRVTITVPSDTYDITWE
jgi:hypothetical protein